MKLIDLDLRPPQILNDPNATRELAAMVSKLQEILKFIVDNLAVVEVVTSAPVATGMNETGDEAGKIKAEFKILHHATQNERKLYYVYKNTVYLLASA